MHAYIYQFMITFKGNIVQIYRNAFIFANELAVKYNPGIGDSNSIYVLKSVFFCDFSFIDLD